MSRSRAKAIWYAADGLDNNANVSWCFLAHASFPLERAPLNSLTWQAVCNALGSNIFNILLGLGLPWWVKALMDGQPYAVPGMADVGEPLGLLFCYLLLFISILAFGRWKLSPRVGWTLLACQLVYTSWTLLRHLPSDAPIIHF